MFKSIYIKFKYFLLKYTLKRKVKHSIFYTGGRPNIGDSMVPWLIQSISESKLEYSNPLAANGPHLFSIGSILQYANSDSDIWGSGFISSTSRCKSKPNSVLAVRGPLSAERLSELYGIKVDTYGDPAILTPLFLEVNRKEEPDYQVGVIPHYIDKECLASIKFPPTLNVIDVETDDIKGFVRALLDCEVILSSSLHGIIIAEAFNIPAVWIEFSDSVVGNGFKFKDYFLSTARDAQPVRVDGNTDFMQVAEKYASLPPKELIDDLRRKLLDSFPKQYMNI